MKLGRTEDSVRDKVAAEGFSLAQQIEAPETKRRARLSKIAKFDAEPE
jgi:hypothetical protein